MEKREVCWMCVTSEQGGIRDREQVKAHFCVAGLVQEITHVLCVCVHIHVCTLWTLSNSSSFLSSTHASHFLFTIPSAGLRLVTCSFSRKWGCEGTT